MKYQAVYDIDCGVSSGFGVKYPDREKRTESFDVDNSQLAYREAMIIAEKFADDYLSNPDTELTTVQLTSLKCPDGDVSFDASKSIIERSVLEHLLALTSETE